MGFVFSFCLCVVLGFVVVSFGLVWFVQEQNIENVSICSSSTCSFIKRNISKKLHTNNTVLTLT